MNDQKNPQKSKTTKISSLKLKSLHGIKLNHRLCHIICVKLHKETHSSIRDNSRCLLFGNKRDENKSVQLLLWMDKEDRQEKKPNKTQVD